MTAAAVRAAGAPEASSWRSFLEEVLERWHGEAGAGDGPGAGTGGDRAAALDRLGRLDEARRRRFLVLLGRRLREPAWRWLHPSWVRSVLPADPLTRRWALEATPAGVGGLVDDGIAAGAIDGSAAPPAWFGGWWGERVRAVLQFPAPFPWHVDPDDPESYLWSLAPADLSHVLGRWGLRPLAAALAVLGRDHPRRAAALVYAQPDARRPALVERAREGRYPRRQADAWRELVDRHRESPPAELAQRLALADVAAHAGSTAARENARRLAYRLPVELGERLLRDLELDLSELGDDDPEERRRDLAGELEWLIAAGEIEGPELDELRREVAA